MKFGPFHDSGVRINDCKDASVPPAGVSHPLLFSQSKVGVPPETEGRIHPPPSKSLTSFIAINIGTKANVTPLPSSLSGRGGHRCALLSNAEVYQR